MTRLQDLTDRGIAARETLPRSELGIFHAVDRDPISILEDQHRSRLAELVPVRVGRMLQSPFTFYRGSAAIMMTDLAKQPCTGTQVIVCGDAHLTNYGLYASPERRLVFDLNDFDEATNAPWEWDIKRLATSALIAGRDVGLRDDQALDATRELARAYRETLARLMEMTALERYYYRGDTSWLEETLDSETDQLMKSARKKARRQTSNRILGKIVAESSDGGMRIVDEPPIVRHDEQVTLKVGQRLTVNYMRTVRADIAVLLSQFELADVVLRIVGVGSVGMRCYIMLLFGPSDEPLFLQAKEAQPSVLETYGGIPSNPPRHMAEIGPGYQGYRVVSSQRTLQAASDPFLGYLHADGRDYYIRQFRDMKGSLDISELNADQFQRYAALCGSMLARAHAQSPNAGFVTGYLGTSDAFDEAIVAWSQEYADQVTRDYDALAAAAKSGRVPCETGV